MPWREKRVGLRSSFPEDGIDDAENRGSFVGVELQYVPNENGGRGASARVRGARISGHPIRPCRKSLEVQPVQISQLQENDWVGPV